jgi:hypothetical protein
MTAWSGFAAATEEPELSERLARQSWHCVVALLTALTPGS